MPPPARFVTWSSSVTLTITHDCPWHCVYCGFRTDAEGLLSEVECNRLLASARERGAHEALLISGEHPGASRTHRDILRHRGFDDITAFIQWAAGRALDAGLLPHGNFGALDPAMLERLRPWHVSMGLMLENIDDLPHVACEKKAAGRLACIRAAGQLGIPFTSGILIGLGESRVSRLRSLDALAALHAEFDHLQEILIQNYVENPASHGRVAAPPPGLDDYHELISHWRDICPGVAVQIPPNLNPYWEELLPWIDDLGGISANRDEVNPVHPWQLESAYARAAQRHGIELRERPAVYPRYIHPDWIDASLLPRVRSVWEGMQWREERASALP